MKTNHVGQVIFNSTNLIMPHKFVQNKFVQKFVTVSLLLQNSKKYPTFLINCQIKDLIPNCETCQSKLEYIYIDFIF